MLRTLLVGILAVSAAAACSGKSDPPAAQPGVTAGKVVELTGTVTATRGTEVRALARGGEISADDVIDTAAGSRVVILVAHNNARWDLGPNKHGKVGDSLAWTAAKVDRPAAAVVEETSTAGRHADKNAATTDTTTAQKADSEPDMTPKGGEPSPATAAPAEQPHPESAPTPEPTATPVAAGGESEKPMRDQAPSREKEPKTESSKVAPNNAPSRRATDDTAMFGGDNGSLGVSGTQPSGGAGHGGGSLGIAAESKPDPARELQTEIRRTFVRERTAMQACLDAAAPSVLISITVAKGKYTITSPDPAATAKTRACLAKIARRLAATKSATPVTVKVTLAK